MARLVLAVAVLVLGCLTLSVQCRKPTFSEQLTLTPLEDGQVIVQFDFDLVEDIAQQHYSLFPKPFAQVLERWTVDEMSLKLTHGRWSSETWGYPPVWLGPQGAELTARFEQQQHSTDDLNWKGLVGSLSGLFCSSLNHMHVKDSVVPVHLPRRSQSDSHNQLYYATLPLEIVCTENLTPWSKMLPCQTAAGLASLLNPLHVFNSSYQSISVQARREHVLSEEGQHVVTHTVKQQLVTVLDPKSVDWTLKELLGIYDDFDHNITACGLSETSQVKLQLNPWIGSKYPSVSAALEVPGGVQVGALEALAPVAVTEDVTVALAGDGVTVDYTDKVVTFDLNTLSDSIGSPGFDLQFTLAEPYSHRRPVHSGSGTVEVSKYATGYGSYDGQVTVEFYNTDVEHTKTIEYFDYFLHFLRIYSSTLSIYTVDSDGARNAVLISELPASEHVVFTPLQPGVQPAVLELKLSLQPLERLVVTLAYDKVFLPIEEFPPDVSRGFDIPQGVLTVDGQHRVYTDAVLVMLPYPDQSMPFNVIAFVSTLFSLIIGNIFNSLYSTDQEVKDRINRGVVPNRFAGIFSKCKKKKKKQDKSAETTTKEIETKTENVK